MSDGKWEGFSDEEISYLYELLAGEFDRAHHYPDEHLDWKDHGSPLWGEVRLAAKTRGFWWA